MVLESRIQTGRKGEDWAIQALSSPSRQLLATNWRWRRHEIDAVFMELDTVVFLEVKTRTGCGTNLTGNLPMPDTPQQQRIILAKLHSLSDDCCALGCHEEMRLACERKSR